MDAEGKLTGRPDGKIDGADRTFIGSPVPKFLGGVNFKVSFWALSMLKRMSILLWATKSSTCRNGTPTSIHPFSGAAVSARVKDSWTPTNTGAELPIFENVSNFSTNTQANSFYVEDGSYLRMQNLSIGYSMPTSVTNALRMKRLRVYASTNNVFTISKYKGLDPGVGGAVDTNFRC